jgi:hypothetical protein
MTTTLERPADSAGALYVKTPVTPEEIFQAIGRLRKEARDEIDRLIRFLDETDNHMELEPEDEGDDAEDEPSLGFLDHMFNQTRVCEGGSIDAEDEHDGAEPDEDGEPSLGAFEGHDNQRVAWLVGSVNDYELDPAESGIADYDGLLEQIGAPDWQGPRGGMI